MTRGRVLRALTYLHSVGSMPDRAAKIARRNLLPFSFFARLIYWDSLVGRVAGNRRCAKWKQ
jgi:hypothetical protein